MPKLLTVYIKNLDGSQFTVYGYENQYMDEFLFKVFKTAIEEGYRCIDFVEDVTLIFKGKRVSEKRFRTLQNAGITDYSTVQSMYAFMSLDSRIARANNPYKKYEKNTWCWKCQNSKVSEQYSGLCYSCSKDYQRPSFPTKNFTTQAEKKLFYMKWEIFDYQLQYEMAQHSKVQIKKDLEEKITQLEKQLSSKTNQLANLKEKIIRSQSSIEEIKEEKHEKEELVEEKQKQIKNLKKELQQAISERDKSFKQTKMISIQKNDLQNTIKGYETRIKNLVEENQELRNKANAKQSNENSNKQKEQFEKEIEKQKKINQEKQKEIQKLMDQLERYTEPEKSQFTEKEMQKPEPSQPSEESQMKKESASKDKKFKKNKVYFEQESFDKEAYRKQQEINKKIEEDLKNQNIPKSTSEDDYLFKQLDLNGDGFISKFEFIMFLRRLDINHNTEFVNSIFKQYGDKEGNEMSKKQFTDYWKNSNDFNV